jgi:propanediol dehydratase large subunit
VLSALVAGIESRGLKARIVRMHHTADTSFLGLSAARLSGSGLGIGLQAKGTAVIHQKDRLPHNNLELFSNAPLVHLAHYRRLGENAASYALGERPSRWSCPRRARPWARAHHARVALIYAIETSLIADGGQPEELEIAISEAVT